MEIQSPEVIPTPEHVATLERLGDEIAELSAHLDAAMARLLDLIRAFDARAGWGNGFRSCADWLSWRVGLDKGAARERVRVARALGTLPRLACAFARGEISYSKVRALTRVATPETEEQLLGVARAGTAVHVERIVRGWRRVDRQAEAQESARHHESRALHVSHDDDGMVVIRGRLAPEVGALLRRALEAARETLYQQSRAEVRATDPAQDVPTMEQQRADALALIAETALPDGALAFRRPDGRVLPDVPPAPLVPADPVHALWDTNVRHGLNIDARTACVGWLGERLDVNWAIDVLHPRANPSQVGREGSASDLGH